LPTDDRTGTAKVTCSDKLDNKPDVALAEVVEAWARLPDAIRSAIVAIVRASIDREER
jgi:hypothetical protein